MKRTLLILTACLAIGAQASTITLDSSASNDTNSTGKPTLDINPNPAWAAALPGSFWVSFIQSGNPTVPGYVQVLNGSEVTFTQRFYLDAAATAATLSVMADDTTSVILNGHTIFAATNLGAKGYPTCSAQPIGCLATTMETFTFAALAPYLRAGNNTIQFGVEQKNSVAFGLDYAGSISTTVPEPASLALIGSGLALLGLASRRLRGPSQASERESNP